MGLMDGYLDKNHVVIMDNFFSSIPLFSDLLTRSTYACGTIRANRKYLPDHFDIEEDMEPGESEIWQSDNFVATLWQDKRAVRFLRTCCEPEGDDTVERRRKKEGTFSLNCPPILKLYTKYMGGVDRSDRMVRTYSASRQSKKWWFRLFYYFLDMSVANSFILYNNSPNHDELSELDYVKQLSLALIGSFSGDEKVQPRAQRKRKRTPAIPRVVAGNHYPELTKKRSDAPIVHGREVRDRDLNTSVKPVMFIFVFFPALKNTILALTNKEGVIVSIVLLVLYLGYKYVRILFCPP